MDTTTTTTTPPSAEFLAETKAPMLYAGLWTFTAVTSVILGLRLYVRLRLSTVHGIDDALATVSWVLLAVFVAVDSVATSLGLGRHAAYLAAAGDDTVPRIVFYLWLGNSLATMANSLAKTSFAFTLLRILPQRWARTLLWAVAVSLNLANACLVVFIYAQCADARSVWDPARYPSRCWPPSVLTDFAIFVGAYSGAMDFVLAVLPWTVLPKLQMRAREKFGVAVAMSLGVVAGAASIVKTVNLQSLSLSDATWGQADLVMWGCVEVSLTIMAASIPTLRPLARKFFPGSSAGRSSAEAAAAAAAAAGSSYRLHRLEKGKRSVAARPGALAGNVVTIGAKVAGGRGGGVGLGVNAGAGTHYDDDSDRSILHGDEAVSTTEFPDNGIKATTEVCVRYE